ncbi:MAG: helix-turn-helix domain-containing protein [Desulfotomaculaceae bacterium]|nr:helix-turn-helix domain-containing protein [Desulfotomaculaceae bacterium]
MCGGTTPSSGEGDPRRLAPKALPRLDHMAKLGKGENVTTDVLVKICKALDCDISDIVEIVEG